MPASTFDSVNSALRNSFSKNNNNGAVVTANDSDDLDEHLAGVSKKALLADIEFEPAGSYQINVLDKLKSKYIALRGPETSSTR